MATQHEIAQWLEEGILAAKNENREQARFRLLDVVEQDQTNETAWFWLYKVFDRRDDKRICLENLITINPGNEWARQELSIYLDPSEVAKLQVQKTPEPFTDNTLYRPVLLKLVGAFWMGISIILLGGGIMAIGEWFVSALRSRTFPNYLTSTQAFELLVALILVTVGFMGLIVAIGLFFRSMVGVYGSLFLALGLLLTGPTISLIASPPNYLALVCTGGISGMIVLLTLASHPSFSETQQKNEPTTS